MLSKKEEYKLDSITAIIEVSKTAKQFPRLSSYEVEWLATKLKETNDTLKELEEEVAKNLGLPEINHKIPCSERSCGTCRTEGL
jgi:hypothetical protein